MTRLVRFVAGVLVAGSSLTALADPGGNPGHPARRPLLTKPGLPKARSPYTLTNQTLFLNRCVGGCNVHPGLDDASTDTSEIASVEASIPEFAWPAGVWEGVVQCIKDAYSPYNVTVTDVRPASGVYNETIVAGSSNSIGAPNSCGFGIVNMDCGPNTTGVAFAFVDGDHAGDCLAQYAQEDGGSQINGMCWVVAQESAHNYGLDHEIMFTDGMSACSDPMTYQDDCGGEKFFRNEFASCSENITGAPKPFCGSSNTCGTTQNSHQKLLQALGAGTPTTTPPVVAITLPQAGITVQGGQGVHATASAQRGIGTTELWLNGFKWASTPGVAFGPMGQPAADYAMAIPNDVPDSVIDIVVKAYDDILVETDSAAVTVTKGKAGGCVASKVNPDGTIDTCAKGQTCDATGRCAWATPAGMLGDVCTYPQFCVSNDCQGTADKQICTESCFVSIADSCPMGFTCAMTNGNNGICFPDDGGGGGGCCSVGHEDSGAILAHGGLALGALALMFRRRRRRA